VTLILAIDPGPEQSAFLHYDLEAARPNGFGIASNAEVLKHCRFLPATVEVVVLERIEGFGMPVGVETFETVYWSGRFHEAALTDAGARIERIGRKAVKVHLCGNTRAKDPNIRTALLDRFGGEHAAKGTKRQPGPLYGIAKDVWSALALAVTYADTAGRSSS
jgi:hypothetical protein